MNTHTKNPRINRQDKQNITFPGSAYQKEISQQCTPATHTQKQCTDRGSSWGLPSLSLTTEGSWIHLGEGRQTSRQPADASTPEAAIGTEAEPRPIHVNFSSRLTR